MKLGLYECTLFDRPKLPTGVICEEPLRQGYQCVLIIMLCDDEFWIKSAIFPVEPSEFVLIEIHTELLCSRQLLEIMKLSKKEYSDILDQEPEYVEAEIKLLNRGADPSKYLKSSLASEDNWIVLENWAAWKGLRVKDRFIQYVELKDGKDKMTRETFAQACWRLGLRVVK